MNNLHINARFAYLMQELHTINKYANEVSIGKHRKSCPETDVYTIYVYEDANTQGGGAGRACASGSVRVVAGHGLMIGRTGRLPENRGVNIVAY